MAHLKKQNSYEIYLHIGQLLTYVRNSQWHKQILELKKTRK